MYALKKNMTLGQLLKVNVFVSNSDVDDIYAEKEAKWKFITFFVGLKFV